MDDIIEITDPASSTPAPKLHLTPEEREETPAWALEMLDNVVSLAKEHEARHEAFLRAEARERRRRQKQNLRDTYSSLRLGRINRSLVSWKLRRKKKLEAEATQKEEEEEQCEVSPGEIAYE